MVAEKIPSITLELLTKLQRTFPPVEITPDTEINQIMFSAGHQEVIRWLERHKRESSVLGDINATRS